MHKEMEAGKNDGKKGKRMKRMKGRREWNKKKGRR
jgi:hypothetical protein